MLCRRVLLLVAVLSLLSVSCVLAVPYSDRILSHGPTTYVRLGDAVGSVQAANIGSLAGNYTYDSGVHAPVPGKAGALVGDSNNATSFISQTAVSQGAPCPALEDEFSVVFYIKIQRDISTAYNSVIFMRGNSFPLLYVDLALRSGQTLFGYYSPSNSQYVYAYSPVTPVSWVIGQWVHIAATWTRASNSVTFYRNGVMEGTGPVPMTNMGVPSAGSSSERCSIGANTGGGATVNAELDELATFSKVITSAEIAELYAIGQGQCLPGTFSANGKVTAAGGCQVCPAGTFSASSATTCTPCAVNTFSPAGAASCTACAAGEVNTAGSPWCCSTMRPIQSAYAALQNDAGCSPANVNTVTTILAADKAKFCAL